MTTTRRGCRGSWQRVGARLAVALLLAALLGGVAAPRVAADAKLPPGWTHVFGTGGCALFYAKGGTALHAYPVADGRLDRTAGRAFGTASDWTNVVGTGAYLYFYNRLTGKVNGFPFDDNCTPFPGKAYGGYGTWTHVVGIGDAVLLFYNKATGAFASGWLDGTASFQPTQTGFFDAGWSHIVAASNRVLFYKAGTVGSNAATGLFDSQGRFTQTNNYGFAGDFTSLAGTRNGGFVFYNRLTGLGMTGRLDPTGAWRLYDGNVNFGKGWTHVTGVGGRTLVTGALSRGVLFYNRNTGSGLGGYLAGAGKWVPSAAYDGS